MNKKQAVVYMEEQVEKIERECMATNFSVDSSKQKKEAVNQILKALKEVQIEDEDQQD